MENIGRQKRQLFTISWPLLKFWSDGGYLNKLFELWCQEQINERKLIFYTPTCEHLLTLKGKIGKVSKFTFSENFSAVFYSVYEIVTIFW